MIRLRTFKGGIRLPEHKEFTKDRQIEVLPLPPRVIIHLNQNVGIPPRPVVEMEQRVKTGEVIAEPDGAVSSTLHASVAGVVKTIALHPHPAGPDSLAIEIETDPEAQPQDFLPPLKDWSHLSPEEIRDRVLQAGIVGLGGAGFPTQVKLEPPPGQEIEYAIINGAECEPFLTVDHRLLLEETEKVLIGLKIIMRATGAQKGVIAIEANKKDAFEKVRAKVQDDEADQVELLKVKYPQGAEKQLIYSLLRREVPAGGFPPAVGCVVQNVHTAVSIAEAFLEGRPLIERVITVTGPRLKNRGNFRVRIGTPFYYLIQAAGGLPEGAVKIISGGPMMGIAQCNLSTPVIKGTSGLLVLKADPRPRNLPCLRCGKCITVCPLGLSPCDLATVAEKEDWDNFEKLGGAHCIECGCCAYVCPAARDLVQFIQLGKSSLNKAKSK